MRYSPTLLSGLLSLAPSALAVTNIWLAGDSTMAPGGGGTGTEGWGQYLKYSFESSEYVVNNEAIAGRSARSYWREGRFQAIADELSSGDWVVIELGHNDGGSLSDDDGLTDCPGSGAQICYSEYDGVNETIYTYPAYLEMASKLYLAKGAKVIISSPTPDNPWETGTFTWVPNRFEYATQVLGGPSAGVYFVSHGDYAAQLEKNLGATVTDENFPLDHTHTAPYLANLVAGAFVLGLKCGTSALGAAAINSTASLEATDLGDCISWNSTISALI
ncbi:family 12 carbohydrate esterase [Cryphonectria parasitica EP155]|uniref:Family 12 carbohydrate esterase n=1 Tax=Cryphonectria parasitica (strain ATCC 38755 / EP155) TaxID=660469 RepID=A0A9P4YCL9_CRYP1|nr:family 12 carbohydrate esterase [Cryphonectria parasitica EP155]KAF3771069.1 family 12 carbohydrate esterase [Cryphonectria parasitica EP155]